MDFLTFLIYAVTISFFTVAIFDFAYSVVLKSLLDTIDAYSPNSQPINYFPSLMEIVETTPEVRTKAKTVSTKPQTSKKTQAYTKSKTTSSINKKAQKPLKSPTKQTRPKNSRKTLQKV